MRKTPRGKEMSIDEFERFQTAIIKPFEKPNFRLGKRDAVIKSDSHDGTLIFRLKKGSVEISVKGYSQIKSIDRKKCDLGHFHDVEVEKQFVYFTYEIELGDICRLARWMLNWGPVDTEEE